MVNINKSTDENSGQYPAGPIQPTEVVTDTTLTKYCHVCAATLPKDATVCTFCGCEQPMFQQQPTVEQQPAFQQQTAYQQPNAFQQQPVYQQQQQIQPMAQQQPMPQRVPMPQPTVQPMNNTATKFCKFCAATIPMDAVVCTSCVRQVEELSQRSQPAPQVIVNNTSQSTSNPNININNQVPAGKKKISKWTAFFLCLFLGEFGVHKFYEGKTLMGLLYLFTGGLFGVGWFIDTIAILFKSDPYYT